MLHAEQNALMAVVEPPKFITQRHVAAIFEKMGYDSGAAQKVFQILVEAVSRFKTTNDATSLANMDKITEDANEDDPREAPTPNAALAKAFGDFDDDDDDLPSPAPARASSARTSAPNSSSTRAPPDSPAKPPAAASTPVPDAATARMDFNDFCK